MASVVAQTEVENLPPGLQLVINRMLKFSLNIWKSIKCFLNIHSIYIFPYTKYQETLKKDILQSVYGGKDHEAG